MEGKSKETCEEEDELTEWIQYPLEGSSEKGYCSDLFAQWGVPIFMHPASSSVSSSTVTLAHTSPNVGSFDPGTRSASMMFGSGFPTSRGDSDRGPLFSGVFPIPKEVGPSRPISEFLGSSASVAGSLPVPLGYVATTSRSALTELGLVVPSQASTESGVSCSSNATVPSISGGVLMPVLVDRAGIKTSMGSSHPISSLSRRLVGSVIGADKEHVGTSGSHSRSVMSADGALALGACRAAGLVPQTGFEAFDTVRTSKQPPQLSLKQFPQSTQTQFSSTQHPLFYREKLSHSIPEQSPMRCISKHAKPCVSPSTSGSLKDSQGVGQGATCSSLHTTGLEKVSFGPLGQFCDAQKQIMCSHPMDDEIVRTGLEPANSEGSLVQRHSDCLNKDATGRFSLLAESSSDIKASASELAHLMSQSAGSQTGFHASAREDSSSGKKNFLDSDCQSDDFDVDSIEMKQPGKGSSKRNRAVEVHNLSEKRRRSRINEKMKALQELIPNSCKTDKASMLEEAIEYMKTLQLQLQMVSMRNSMSLGAILEGVPSVPVVPMPLPGVLPPMQIGQMTPVHPVALGVPVGHAGTLDLSQGMIGRPCVAAVPHFRWPHQSSNVITAPAPECSQSAGNRHCSPSVYVSGGHEVQQLASPLNAIQDSHDAKEASHVQHKHS